MPHQLEAWSKQFKKKIATKVKELNTQEQELYLPYERPSEEIYQQLFQVNWNSEAGRQNAFSLLQQYAANAESATKFEEERRAKEEVVRRRYNIQNKERPAPHYTAVIRPRQQAGVAVIRKSNGSLTDDPAEIASIFTRQYASVSAQPTVTQAAQQQVLAAIQQMQPQKMSQAANEAIGASIVTEEEIKLAIKLSKSGKAPGPDGLPLELYRHYRHQLVPVLQRVFTAMGETKTCPPGFLEGVIACLYKTGEEYESSNYRPVTVLHTEYRILAKILARRLAPHLKDIIDKTQGAFVPGRKIGNNIMMLQMVAKKLQSQRKSAFVANCDFRKAYDTIDREFLFQIMTAMGVDEGFLGWVKLLLSDTKAGAMNQGHISKPLAFQAGVRQGCPLAPLLYLFIGQALCCWLKSKNLGVQIESYSTDKTTCDQFADDTKVFLQVDFQTQDWSQVTIFKAAMDTFAAATGQHLNVEKTELLPIGKLPARVRGRLPIPETIEGFKVVEKAKSLGFWHQAGSAALSVDWHDIEEKVKTRCTKIASMGLSLFGRAFAISGYVSSMLLYHAEFCDIPPDRLEKIQRWIAKLIDRAQAPGSNTRRFPGIKAEFLVGHPKLGGIGALPILEHVQARRAGWGLKLVGGEIDHPWAVMAHKMVEMHMNRSDSSVVSLITSQDPPISGLPAFIKQFLEPLAKLPPLQVASEPQGDWCYSAPLWDNPLLSSIDRRAQYQELAYTNMRTVGDLVRAIKRVEAPDNWEKLRLPMTRNFSETLQSIFGYMTSVHLFSRIDMVYTREQLRDMLHGLRATIPMNWISAVETVIQDDAPPPAARDFQQGILEHMGWYKDGWHHWNDMYTVKWGTEKIMGPHLVQVYQRLENFAAMAVPPVTIGGQSITTRHQEVTMLLQKIWKLPIKNEDKEIMWRLIHNGIPTAQRMHNPEMRCGCGHPHPGLDHHYWECPAANIIRILFEECLA